MDELSRYGKFLIIPVVFIVAVMLYVSVINSLAESSFTVRQSSNAEKIAGAEVIGVGQAVSVQVTRATHPYLFGLVNLPTYAQGIGDLTGMHTIFFWLMYIILAASTAGFIILEKKGMNMAVSFKPSSKSSYGNDQSIWLRLGKALGLGAGFALVGYFISGDTSSVPLGLFVAYLEFKMSSS